MPGDSTAIRGSLRCVPSWLIEAGVYGAEAEPLRAEIRRQGMTADFVPYQALQKGSEIVIDRRPIGPTDCVIGYGTYPFARQIQLHRRWVPGAWCQSEALDCTTYFAYFGKYLLNQNYVIMPGIEAIRQREWLFSIFGKDDEVFARPTGCQKLFVGRRVSTRIVRFGLGSSTLRSDDSCRDRRTPADRTGMEARCRGEPHHRGQSICRGGIAVDPSRVPRRSPGVRRGHARRCDLATRPDLHAGLVRIIRTPVASRAEQLQLVLALSMRDACCRCRGERARDPGMDGG